MHIKYQDTSAPALTAEAKSRVQASKFENEPGRNEWAKLCKWTLCALPLFIGVSSPEVSLAQEQVSRNTGTVLEEVIVSARKRDESLQDVPIAISVFSGGEIEAGGYLDLEDIAGHTPGLQFNSDLGDLRPGRLYSSIRFRGIEGGDGALQTANVFVDGIFALQAAQSLSLMDIERIEVIKGPQSAMFGRNTFAGTINYVTKDPNMNEFVGKVNVDAGQYEQYEVAASMEGPLIENKLAARLSARLYNKGDMYTATDGGALGEQSSESISLTIDAFPVESLRLRFRGYHQNDEDGPAASAFLKFTGDDVGNDTCTGTSYRGLDHNGNRVTVFPKDFWCGMIPSPGSPRAPRVDGNTSLLPQYPSFIGDLDGDGLDNSTFLLDKLINSKDPRFADAPSLNHMGIKRKITRLSLVADYGFQNGMSSVTTLAYNENNANAIRDFDTTAIESFYARNPQVSNDKSFETRLQSDSNGRFRWMAGFNYYEQEFLTSTASGDIVHVCGNFGGASSGKFCDFPGFFPVGLTGSDYVDVWGIYTALSYDLTDKITLDAEGRYQSDERSDGVTNLSKTYKDFVPRLSVTYQPNNEFTFYATYSQGVLPGVVNGSFNSCSNVPLTQPFIDPFTGQPSYSTECQQWVEQLGDALQPYTDSQTLDSYEIGMKSIWLNGRLLADLALYQMQWNGQPYGSGVQVYRDSNQDGIPNPSPNFLSASVEGDSEFYGAELQTAFLINENWTTQFNIAYNENEFTEFFVVSNINTAHRIGTDNLKGNRSSRFPKWTGSFTASYERPLESKAGWDLISRADITYTGEAFTGTGNLATIDSYSLVNWRIGVKSEDMTFELYVKNLFDEDKWRGGTNFADFSVISQKGFDFSNGGILLIPQDKRTFGLRVSYQF